VNIHKLSTFLANAVMEIDDSNKEELKAYEFVISKNLKKSLLIFPKRVIIE